MFVAREAAVAVYERQIKLVVQNARVRDTRTRTFMCITTSQSWKYVLGMFRACDNEHLPQRKVSAGAGAAAEDVELPDEGIATLLLSSILTLNAQAVVFASFWLVNLIEVTLRTFFLFGFVQNVLQVCFLHRLYQNSKWNCHSYSHVWPLGKHILLFLITTLCYVLRL